MRKKGSAVKDKVNQYIQERRTGETPGRGDGEEDIHGGASASASASAEVVRDQGEDDASREVDREQAHPVFSIGGEELLTDSDDEFGSDDGNTGPPPPTSTPFDDGAASSTLPGSSTIAAAVPASPIRDRYEPKEEVEVSSWMESNDVWFYNCSAISKIGHEEARYLVLSPRYVTSLEAHRKKMGVAYVRTHNALSQLTKLTFKKKNPHVLKFGFATNPSNPDKLTWHSYKLLEPKLVVDMIQTNLAALAAQP